MNQHEAYKLLADTLHAYQHYAFNELKSLTGTAQSQRVIGPSGNEFLLDVSIDWADRQHTRIQITATADSPSVFRMERLEERIFVAEDAI